MNNYGSTIQNSALSGLQARAGTRVSSAIQQASASTGVDFAYLMQQADAESSFKTSAKASTSSATGLFQFIDSTWMNMVKAHGDKYGIDTNQSRSELLKLRNDPEISSYMAAELASDNKSYLEDVLPEGTKIGSTELYLAHFMGAGRAAGFIEAKEADPYRPAADLFPAEARANRGVFYNSEGKARSLAEVYAFFDKKFDIEGGSATAMADASASIPQIQPDSNGDKLKAYMQAHEKQMETQRAEKFADVDPIDRLAAANPYMDLLGGGMPSLRLPIMGSKNRFGNEPSADKIAAQLGISANILKNPADILWLSQLDDNLAKQKTL
ncbi:MAG: transglycosylase SLT domain-containing protein [Pseudobdellovibrionaceae bacterium]